MRHPALTASARSSASSLGPALGLALACALAGCGDGGGGALTDRQYCDRACARLIACGVQYDSSCAVGCLQAPVFLACAKTSPDECNPLALCAFQQGAALFCAGSGGYPTGAGTCNAAAMCEGQCNAGGQPPSCGCACVAQMSPAKAINLLINNQCALALCPNECSPQGSGPACNTCFAQRCQAQSGQCLAN